MTAQLIHGSIEINRLNINFDFTAVYELHTIAERKPLWDKLRSIHSTYQGPWLAMGDYNVVASINDRLVGSPVLEVEMGDFKEYLHDTGTVDLKQVGRNFTWTNSHVFSTIDRALVNSD
ncbi:hypothetical protein MTR67_036566 [Solanum verrucosum]|uniref:Uncharacterized protein n=1 Tax=Solanum verrucosum TaxID=315347 RepID=A0AAF0UCS7_SOLVR|nr:hypothetical protein MTR67_036566 [Solanum verrucosum]